MTRSIGMSRLAPVIAMLTWLAACAGPSDGVFEASHYIASPAAYVFGRHATPNVATYVNGNPFGLSQESLAKTVAAAMDAAVASRDVHFVVNRGETVRTNMLVVVAFDPGINIGPGRLCASPSAVASVPSSDQVDIVMAFCLGDRTASGVRGRLRRPVAASDRVFVSTIARMTEALFGTGAEKRSYRSF